MNADITEQADICQGFLTSATTALRDLAREAEITGDGGGTDHAVLTRCVLTFGATLGELAELLELIKKRADAEAEAEVKP